MNRKEKIKWLEIDKKNGQLIGFQTENGDDNTTDGNTANANKFKLWNILLL